METPGEKGETPLFRSLSVFKDLFARGYLIQ